MLVSWYGVNPDTPAVPRKVVKSSYENLIEVRFFSFKYALHSDSASSQPGEISKYSTLADLKSMICTSLGVADDEKSRMYHKYFSYSNTVLKNLTQTINEAYLYSDYVIYIEIQNEDGTWPTDDTKKTAAKSAMTGYTSGTSSYSSNYTSSYTRPQATTPPGLGNLGNTCFMNSGLQCLLNSSPLAKYFVDKKYSDDLNIDNPIGCKGKLAEAFYDLVIRMREVGYSVSPTMMKEIISKFAPQFSGYQQHDSQELIVFMLDGLHEDLNRVKKKPYIEEDPKDELLPAAERAAKQWTNHKRRNDSVIVDTFHGQFQSTLVCPDCGKVLIITLS